MVLVLICIVLICGLVVYQFMPKLLSYSTVLTLKKQDTRELTHDGITDVLTRLGHPQFEGVCYGFTLNWALAVAQSKESFFYRQLHHLRTHQFDLPTTLQQIEEKKEKKQSLSKDEAVIDTLPQLGKKICIAQDPLQYKEKYRKLVWQPDINSILKTINNSDSCVAKHFFYKTHSFSNQEEATEYFELLKRIGIKEDTAVIISTADHAMGFKLAGNVWRFININDLFQQDKNKPYFEFSSRNLVNELYRVCAENLQGSRLTVNTDFISVNPQEKLSKALQNVFPVFPVKTKTTYPERLAFFSMAATQGDMDSVKKCINAGWSIFSRQRLSDDSPIITAIYLGRREVVRAMLSTSRHRVNQKRKSDSSTLLHIACRYGGSGIVEDLLNIRGIKIDPQDSKGRTPLMYACKKTVVTNDKKLFNLLFAKGASLSIKDNDGLTALDHAVKNEHTLAIQMIEERLEKEACAKLGSRSRQFKFSDTKGTLFQRGVKTISYQSQQPSLSMK
ncbi:TPA: ankyrin repeat domain-containing protein [Legionella pneumophila]|nr:ankyrin repeat domain-containing protein [Legionella pneumophila]HAT8181918.1 ankyrin repeat domain-containing protein [Legionella pneumophila]